MLALHREEMFDHCVERLVPTNACQFSILAKQGVFRSVGCFQRVVLGKSLWAERAGIDGMRGIPTHRYGPAILDAEEHAAANRAIAAGGGHPTVRDLALRGVPGGLIGCVGVLFRENVEAEMAFQTHAAFCSAA